MSPAKKTITIGHLYPREMNIYGDMGNVITLKKRLEWRGFEVKVKALEVGVPFDFKSVDLLFGGGGQDSGQKVVGPDLIKRGAAIRKAAQDGMPMLVICGLYQLFGRGFTTMEGQEIPGIAVFRAQTEGSTTRMIGNIVTESLFGRLVGFENHSGVTKLDEGQEPLGQVLKGFGNDPSRAYEGAVYKNTVGTYLHGPILPKNPDLADWLLAAAVKRSLGIAELKPLDNELELAAREVAADRPE